MSAQAGAVSRQGMLSGDQLEGIETDEVGYRGPIACSAAGITYRQLDYWARTGLLQPSIRAARGSGSQRLYSFRDILVLKIVKKLLDAGVSLQQVRVAGRRLPAEQGSGRPGVDHPYERWSLRLRVHIDRRGH